ncbi:MAG: divergent polysaccharide deacetylase family protein [Magnetococcales bacterium]|nr:divergent polysaccharide deacetylase family protein [Magnetococcales bacterium]NGZ27938.1 divergent polysaccharide deacetylase family protein [Magnetococcales bacterium]
MATPSRSRSRRSRAVRWDYLLAGTLVVVLMAGVGYFLWKDYKGKETKSHVITVPPRPNPSAKQRLEQTVMAIKEPPAPEPAKEQTKPTTKEPSKVVDEESRPLYEEHFSGKEPPPPPMPPRRKVVPPRTGEPSVAVAVVIDDLGFHAHVSKAIARLPADITLAILPYGPSSREVAEIGHKVGKEIILHQPMEPVEYPRIHPGNGAIITGMGDGEIQTIVKQNLDYFPEAVGINNHMGSRITTQVAAMDSVMKVLRTRGLFFLDSRTSQRSVAFDRALAAGIPAASRQVFIDNVQRADVILSQLNQLEKTGRQHGGAIGIGHPYPETLQALEQWLPGLAGRQIRVVRVSHFLSHNKNGSGKSP